MSLENVSIGRICLHEVYVRSDHGAVVPPTYGAGLLQLDARAMNAFRSRVIAAFKSSSQCMEMAIREFGAGSAIANSASLIGAADPAFVQQTRAFADSLANAQASRAIPGGLMVVFDGTVGFPATPFVGLMKAELHEGFIKTNNLQARFESNLFLSPKTKLYKIGLFTSDGNQPRPILPNGWTPLVYDSAMTGSNRDAAATYFYSTFLGLDIPVNAAQQVRKFFEETRTFIKNSNLPLEQKVDLHNTLYSYLKVDQGNTIQTTRFAQTYMDVDLAADYLTHMRRENFPTTAIAKDLTEVSGSLRMRKFRFPRSITLQGPPDAVSDLVTVQNVPGDGDQVWTRITIKARIQGQE